MLGNLSRLLYACREDSSQGLKSTFFGPDGKRPMGFKEFSAFIEGELVVPRSCPVTRQEIYQDPRKRDLAPPSHLYLLHGSLNFLSNPL